MRILGINALFHDPAAALVAGGRIVSATEEERFSRRKHGKRPVPFAAWELPERAARWCLADVGLRASDLDAVAYSFDPALGRPADTMGLTDPWDGLRRTYAAEAPSFLAEALPGARPRTRPLRPPPRRPRRLRRTGRAAPRQRRAGPRRARRVRLTPG
ncbi:hypothetical protein GCM10020000_01900 [Streptomyces olivoverticillatus]